MIKTIITHSQTITDKNDKAVPWWSFTKTIMASAILKLVEQNKIDLDSCLEGQRFTYRQLLQHTSGLKDYGSLASYHVAVKNGDKPWSEDQLFNQLNINELLFEPGKGWCYSNIGYLLLKHEIERICNSDLATALNSLLFTPLNLDGVKVITTPKDFANLYLSKHNYDPAWCYHGLLAGTTALAAQFLHLLSSGQIVSSDSLAEMLLPYQLNIDVGDRPWIHPAVGLGLMMEYDNGIQSYGNSGQGPDSTIAIYHFMKDKAEPVTVAVFEETNDMAIVENEAVDLACSL